MLDIIKTTTKESLFYKGPTLLADIAIQLGTLEWVLYGTNQVRPENLVLYQMKGTILLLVVSVLMTASLIGVRVNERSRSAVNIAAHSVLSAVLTWVFFNGLMAIIYELVLQGKLLALQLVVTSALYVILHLAIRQLIIGIRKRGKNNYTMLMVGSSPNMTSIFNDLRQGFSDKGYNFLGFFTEHPEEVPAESKYLGGIQDCFPYIEENYAVIKEVLCSEDPARHRETVSRLVDLCDRKMIRFKYVPELEGYPKRKMLFSELGHVNVISLHEEPLNTPLAKIVKRSADIVLSFLFLITLFPFIWLFCAIGIKLSSPGPVFFKQKRTGYEGKVFWCYKFRSMHVSADADTKQAVKGDNRVFKFGEFLRKSSIDELPQFINILRGDMSVIGPRPHMLHHTDIYSSLIGDYMIRHLAKPGLTGWAQVNGCRGETRELSEMKDRVEKDIWYIEHWSVELDVSIFLMTLWQFLRHNDQKAY